MMYDSWFTDLTSLSEMEHEICISDMRAHAGIE